MMMRGMRLARSRVSAGSRVSAVWIVAAVFVCGWVAQASAGTGAVSVSVVRAQAAPPVFGFANFSPLIEGVGGATDTQAGDHPSAFVVKIDPTTDINEGPGPNDGLVENSVEDIRDIVVQLPPGFVGSALATPRCTFTQLDSGRHCPPNTAIGHIQTEPPEITAIGGPLFNMVPEHGVAAQFGFTDRVLNTAHVLDVGVVPSPGGYTLRVTSPEIPQVLLTSIETSLFGDPAATDETGDTPVAQFTNSSDCSGEPLVTSAHMDSWPNPGGYEADGAPDFSDPQWAGASSESPAVTECQRLQFAPSLSTQPEGGAADSATGLQTDIAVAQNEAPGSLATPPLRDATITLPAGLVFNPAAAGGLGSCSEAQIGWLGGSLTNFTAGPPECPEDSKVGTVEAETPALSGVLEGSVYLASQGENPFGSVLAGYLVIDDPTTGIVMKIPGNLTPNPQTGQITAVFDENPQFQVSNLRLHFFGGARGELATPPGCGTFTTTSDLMPWSAPGSGPDATPSSSFQIESGCTNAFAPGFTAGSENPQAGAYTPVVLSFSRNDGEQFFAGTTQTLPEGLLGKIVGIPLCSNAQASAGACPEASHVGSVQTGAGVGPDPYFVSGKAYLTGPYNGGPFGLAIEVPAVAGPFNLGTVVVRVSLRINSQTGQVTAVSDPLPSILDGIPLQVRRVNVALDRPGFTFNPTSCAVMQVAGSLSSTAGSTANVSNRFQAGGCGELPFKPVFAVSMQAKASKQNGASLSVTLTSAQGQANIGKVTVSLPKQLPSRLTTIQQACPEATYDANPASCPAGSDIGTAIARTPVLASPLVGPAYLVSHGGAAFPNLVLILQGEGVTLDLVGSIDIKKGITSSAFESVPDAPISSFELALPEGPHSGLAANLPAKAKYSFCGQSLVMPTTLTGQNGAQIIQQTKVQITGCPKIKPKAKKQRKAHRKAKKQGKR
jgi:hypothetical protein